MISSDLSDSVFAFLFHSGWTHCRLAETQTLCSNTDRERTGERKKDFKGNLMFFIEA